MDVQFQDEPQTTVRFATPRNKGLSGFLIHHGFAKDEAQAGKLLLGLCAACLVVAAGCGYS
jgi:hypothetical protein